MKKIVALTLFLLAFTANSFAIKVYCYFVGVVSPGCFRVHVIVTDIIDGTEQELGSGYANIGSGCLGQNITTAPGSSNDFGDLMKRYPEIKIAIDDFEKTGIPK